MNVRMRSLWGYRKVEEVPEEKGRKGGREGGREGGR